MTTTTTAPEPAQECLSDLFGRLEAEGANLEHLRAVADAERRLHNAEAIRLGRLYFAGSESERVSPFDFANHLEDMTSRVWGLKALMHGFDDDLSENKFWSGAHQIATDVAREMERLHEAFAAEVAANRPAPVSGRALSLAFTRLIAARQAIARHEGADDLPKQLVDAENAAEMALALCPCQTEDVPTKLRELIWVHKRDFGDHWQATGAPALLAAIDFHFGKGFDERQTAEAAKTWAAYVGADGEGEAVGSVSLTETGDDGLPRLKPHLRGEA
jgi:hypothetical protein